MEGEEKLTKELRAIIISCKGGISLRDLRRDYLDLGGSPDLYKNLGFGSIDDFVYARHDEFRIRNGMVTAVLKEESAHIQKLVNEQGGKRRSRIIPVDAPPRRPRERGGYSRPSYSSMPPRGRSGYDAPQGFSHSNGSRTTVPVISNPNRMVSESSPRVIIGARDDHVANRWNWLKAESNVARLVKKTWPSELFLGDGPKRGTQREVAPRFKRPDPAPTNGLQVLNERLANNAKDVSDVPFSKFKAKEPILREPYRHTSSQDLDADHNYEDMFKIVPPLEDPVPHSHTTKKLPPDSQPTVPSTVTSIPLKLPNSTLPPPPSPSDLSSKNPVASRFSRLQAQTQISVENQVKPPSRDIQNRLIRICEARGIPLPDYKLMTHARGDQTLYTCYIKVGDHVISTGPATPDVDTARYLAISKAYMVLSAEPDTTSPPPTATATSSSDTTLFCSRLRQMLDKKPSGLWFEMLADAYKEEYGTEAPPQWQDLVVGSSSFTLSNVLERQLVQNAPLTLEGPPPGFEKTLTPMLTIHPPMFGQPPPGFQYSANSSLLAEAALVPLPLSPEEKPLNRQLATLVTPNSKFWDLYILVADTPRELVGRIIGKDWSDLHDEVMATLEIEMLSGGVPVKAPIPNEIYAINITGSWLRARLLRLISEDKAEIAYLDDGGDDIVDVDQIFHLDDKFLDLAPQALRFSLNGLDAFPEVPHLRRIMADQLLRRICVAEVVKSYPERPNSVRAHVVLWDTSTPDDINVNSLLMEQVVACMRAPSLTLGTTREMVVSHVDEAVYLRTNDRNLECIASLIDYTITCASFDDASLRKAVRGKVYLVLNSTTKTYQRVKVLDASDDSALLIFYIDYGTTGQASLSKLYDADTFCRAVSIAPAQAVKIELLGLMSLSPQKSASARAAMPLGEIVVAKVIDMKADVPVVELYRRDPVNQVLKSINTMLKAVNSTDEDELKKFTDQILPLPSLPTNGQLVYVYVTLAASPTVFQVQLMNSFDQLTQLMCDLEAAGLSDAPIPDIASLYPGKYYAVLHAGSWYRGKLNAAFGDDAVSVELSDFGTLVLLPLDCVRELSSSFLILPRQALRATLAGVVPVNGDWTPSDCVFFQELVADKNLAAIVAGVRFETESPVLELRLIDTSDPDKDVDIVNLLVERGVAALIH